MRPGMRRTAIWRRIALLTLTFVFNCIVGEIQLFDRTDRESMGETCAEVTESRSELGSVARKKRLLFQIAIDQMQVFDRFRQAADSAELFEIFR